MWCRHLTKSGGKCKGDTSGGIACRVHATDDDLLLNAALRARWNSAFMDGFEAGKESAASALQDELRMDDERRKFRHSKGGDQIVVVNGRYTYKWSGAPLQVGDRVVIPPNWLVGRNQVATVTALGSSYDGDVASIVGLAS